MRIILTDQKCEACEGGVPPLTAGEVAALQPQVPEWEVAADGHGMPCAISRAYTCKNFQTALDFINAVGKLAEQEGHHPDLHLTNYKHVSIELTTHAIGGLSKNDFILAAKIDTLDT